MGQLFAGFERSIGAELYSFKYHHPILGGSRLGPDDTMESLGLMDGDAINAEKEMVGC